jgi:PncC family amidohydrolase
MKNFKDIIEELKKRGETISTMESCTGGGIADSITSIEGASEVLKFSAVTYSNEYKIKMGVREETINKYSVYSMETAYDMSEAISKYANSDMGIGITGKLNKADINNNFGKDNQVFISIYYKKKHYDLVVNVDKNSRVENKLALIDIIIDRIGEILWEEELTE